ncbi:MAG: DUF4424 domain-containing protein [Mesorhizobium sp.]
MLRRVLLAGLALTALPVFANDSTAELGTGGLILSRSDSIAMESEDLFISRDRITVDYVFRNGSETDIDTIVAFPMPDIEGNPDRMVAIPNDPSDNFLGFEVTSDGKEIKPQLEQRAFAAELEIGADLKAQGVPLYPAGEATAAALEKLPQDVADDWVRRGIIVVEEYDEGAGWKKVRTPYWKLQSTYWWRATFPAGKPVHVSHRYKPSVGGTAGLTFFYDGRFQGEYDAYRQRYCLDESFQNAVRKAAGRNAGSDPQMMESRIAYVLTTGGNWAAGSIGKFKLTIDKGDPKSLVSFCGNGVRKTGPTTFEMTADDFYPERNIDILLLDRWSHGD